MNIQKNKIISVNKINKIDTSKNLHKSNNNHMIPKHQNNHLSGEKERTRYKILVGNGCHQAIAEIQGFLFKPTDEEGVFRLRLPDGFEIDATFKNPRLKWLAFNHEDILGLHWYRGYPKMSEGKLVCFQIVAWDNDIPSSNRGQEKWEFIGVWTAQKNLTVQRSMTAKEIRDMAKKTGYIKKFKYSFINYHEWLNTRKLWVGYVYKLICTRHNDTLKIEKVIPYACPRIKPVPKNPRTNPITRD